MRKLLEGYWAATAWFLFSLVLLLLPGSAFPKETWLTKIHFDKAVHFVLFAVLVWLFCRAFFQSNATGRNLTVLFMAFLLGGALYGFLIELVQEYYIANRSFDIGDVVADAVGCLAGYWVSWSRYRKK